MDSELVRQAAVAVRTLSMDLAEELFGQTQASGSDPAARQQLAEDLALLARAEQIILSLNDPRRWTGAPAPPLP